MPPAPEAIPWRPLANLIPTIASLTGAEVLEPQHGKPMLNGGVQAIYDSVGSAETLEIGVRVCDWRAKIVVTGVATPRRFEWTPFYFKEISLIGSNAFGFETYNGRRCHAIEIYFELIKTKGVDVTSILTHRFRLEQYAEALLACRHQEKSRAVKVLFDYKKGGI